MGEVIGDLEGLTDLILRAARQQAMDVEEDARRQADQAREDASAKAQHLQDEIMAVAREEASRDRQRLLAQAALEAQRQHLTAREALLDQVWADAEDQLRQLPESEGYAGVLHRLAAAAVTALGEGPIVLAADPAGHKLLTADRLAEWGEARHAQFVSAEEPADIWGGLLARDSDGRRQFDASFATRLALARSDLREEVAHALGMI